MSPPKTENFQTKKKTKKKKTDILNISAQKQSLWVLVRTALPRRF